VRKQVGLQELAKKRKEIGSFLYFPGEGEERGERTEVERDKAVWVKDIVLRL